MSIWTTQHILLLSTTNFPSSCWVMLWAHNAPETTRHDSFIHFTKYISTLFLFSQLAIPFTVSFSLYQSSGPFVFGDLLCRRGTFLLLASANFHVCLYILLFRLVNTNIMPCLDTKKEQSDISYERKLKYVKAPHISMVGWLVQTKETSNSPGLWRSLDEGLRC